MRLYQAGPLFTAAEIRWHKEFKQQLADAGYVVQWPGDFFTQQEIDDLRMAYPRELDSKTCQLTGSAHVAAGQRRPSTQRKMTYFGGYSRSWRLHQVPAATSC